MNSFKTSIFAGALIFLITGCADEAPWDVKSSSGEGSIKLDLTTSADVTSAIPPVRAEEGFTLSSPSVDEFQIRLTKSDGSYTKMWTSVKDFTDEHNFPVGTYDLEAFYGSVDSQGVAEDNTDYKNAYYYAKQSGVKVTEGGETAVSLHAVLANAVLVVEYTDEFKKYFAKGWSTTLQSQGKPAIEIGDKENITYIIPGTVEVIISATHQNDKKLTLNPGSLEINPQHVYRIRYNVFNGELGQVDQLEIIFDDETEEHIITVDLTDELFQSIAPVVQPDGFEDGEEVESLYGSNYEGNLIFNVMASGEIAEARLTIASSNFKPSYLNNGVIDLCQATAEQQALMEKDGIKALGFFNNPEKMAQLDFTGLCKNLPEGLHEVSLVVKDKNSKANEPVSVKISSLPVEMSVLPMPAVFGQDYAELRISYNGSDPTQANGNPFSFKVRGIMSYEPCRVLSITEVTDQTRSFESKDYIYKISLPEIDRDVLPVRIYFNDGSKPCMETSISFEFEDYSLEADAMTTKAKLRIANMENEPVSKRNAMLGRLRVFVDDNEVEVTRDLTNGYVVINGLQADHTYSVKTTLEKLEVPVDFTDPVEIKTDGTYEVPNGGFEDLKWFVQDKNINQGGRFKASMFGSLSYKTEKYNVQEPSNWATVNKKTCNFDVSNPENTWFVVPSTYNTTGHSGTAMAVRSVGYNYHGTVPEDYSNLLGSSYNPNVPDKGLQAVGKLFLGSYDVQISDNDIVSETYDQGMSFEGRPSALTGYYKYTSIDENGYDDFGLVEVAILCNDKVIAQGKVELNPSSDWKQFKVPFGEDAYSEFGVQATSLKIMFASSNKASESWQEENNSLSVKAYTESTQKFLGSELIVDDLEFEY